MGGICGLLDQSANRGFAGHLRICRLPGAWALAMAVPANRSSKRRATPMPNYETADARACTRERRVRVLGGGRHCGDGWLGLYGFAWSDYETEVRPAYDALTHGHVLEFLRLAPAYGGSLVERAPFALLPGLWGGGALAVYRMVALPCLVAAAVLGVWLVAQMRTVGATKALAGGRAGGLRSQPADTARA